MYLQRTATYLELAVRKLRLIRIH